MEAMHGAMPQSYLMSRARLTPVFFRKKSSCVVSIALVECFLDCFLAPKQGSKIVLWLVIDG